MCGIHFTMRSESSTKLDIEKFFKDAFIVNQVRGQDGAGMFVVPHGDAPNVSFHKARASGSSFLADTRGKQLIEEAAKSWLAVGHVRAATHGSVTTPNTHPFRIVRPDGSCVIGVHNGTLQRWKDHEDAKNHQVDSEWALAMIAKHGTDAFKYFNGAYAFIWWDSKTPDLAYIARNDQRPLHFFYSEDRKTIYGASEAGMLGWLGERNRIAPDAKKGEPSMWYFATDQLYTFDQNDLSYTTTPLPKYDYTLLPYPKSTAYYPGTSLYSYGRSTYSREQEEADAEVWRTRRSDVRDNIYEDGYWPYSYGEFDDPRENRILTGIKTAIKRAKGILTEETVIEGECEVITDEDLQKFTDKAIEKAQTQALSGSILLAHKAIYIKTPQDAAATRAEIEVARDRELYGRVVAFKPEYYDKTAQCVVGEFYRAIEGTAYPEVGELRYDVTESGARNLIDGGGVVLVSVVGINNPDDDNLRGYVVSRLKPEDRDNINNVLRAMVN